MLSIPKSVEVVVFVKVKIDNLNEFSKLKVFKVKIHDNINADITNDINTKNAILIS